MSNGNFHIFEDY